MTKRSRIALSITCILFLCISVMVGAIHHRLSSNKFEDKLVKLVNLSTRDTLEIHGKTQWSFFPWFGFRLNDIKYQNKRKNNQVVMTAPSIEAHIDIGPLLFGSIRINTLRLIKPTTLVEFDSTQYHHMPLISAIAFIPSELKYSYKLLQSKQISLAESANLDIMDGILELKGHDQHITLAHLFMHANNMHPSTPYTISFQAQYQNNLLPNPTNQPIHFSALIHTLEDGYAFNNTHLIIDYTSPLQHLSTWQINGDIKFESNSNGLSFKNFVVSTSEFRAQGALKIDMKGTPPMPSITGNFTIPGFNCRPFLNNFDIQTNTSDSTALSSCQGSLKIGGNKLSFNIKIDDSDIIGSLPLNTASKLPSEIKINTIDLARYFSIKMPAPKPKQPIAPYFNLFHFLLSHFSSINIEKIKVHNLSGTNNHCQQAANNPYLIQCTLADFLSSGMNYNIQLSPTSSSDFVLTATANHLKIESLIKQLPTNSSLSGLLDLSAQLSFGSRPPNINNKSISYSGKLSIHDAQLQGFSLKNLLTTTNQEGYLTSNATLKQKIEAFSTKFSGFNQQVNFSNMILETPHYTASGQGFIHLISGVLSFDMNAVANHQPFEFRVLGTWPNTVKFLSTMTEQDPEASSKAPKNMTEQDPTASSKAPKKKDG